MDGGVEGQRSTWWNGEQRPAGELRAWCEDSWGLSRPLADLEVIHLSDAESFISKNTSSTNRPVHIFSNYFLQKIICCIVHLCVCCSLGQQTAASSSQRTSRTEWVIRNARSCLFHILLLWKCCCPCVFLLHLINRLGRNVPGILEKKTKQELLWICFFQVSILPAGLQEH